MTTNILEQQKKFQELIGNPTHYITAYDKAKAANIMIRRAIDELNEALREIPYDLSGFSKSKKVLSFPIELALDEIVDAQLFISNTLNILGVDSLRFEKLCKRKQDINVQRFQKKQRFQEEGKGMIIVIEGPDGVGKSSICKALSKKLGFPIYRMPDVPKDGDIEKFSQFYRKTISEVNTSMILDRFYPSSIVYGQHFKRDVPLQDIHKIHEKRHICTFIIDTEIPYRDDDFIDEKTFHEIRSIYLSQAKSNKWKIINNNSTLTHCVNQILEELQF